MTAAAVTLWLLVYASVSPDGAHSWANYIMTFPTIAECRRFANSLGEVGLKPERAHCLPVEIR